MEGQECEGGRAETWDLHPKRHPLATGLGPGTGAWWVGPTGRNESIMAGVGTPSSRELRWRQASHRKGQRRGVPGSLGPSAGCSITGFLLHTAGCIAPCCSRRGACLSAFLLLLLAAVAALIALVVIFGSPPRTPGQGGQGRVGQPCWEGVGGSREMGAPSP